MDEELNQHMKLTSANSINVARFLPQAFNDVFYNYLQTGKYEPKASIQTLANAMDVGDPSNFARILNLYSQNGALTSEATHHRMTNLISGATYKDEQIAETMRQCYSETGYVLDPHGACGYKALEEGLQEGEIMEGEKQSVEMSKDFADFKHYLMQQ